MSRQFPIPSASPDELYPGEIEGWFPDPVPGARHREGIAGVVGGRSAEKRGERIAGWERLASEDRRSESRIVFWDEAAPTGWVRQVYITIVFEAAAVMAPTPWRWTAHVVVNEAGVSVTHALAGWCVRSRRTARSLGTAASNAFLQRATDAPPSW